MHKAANGPVTLIKKRVMAFRILGLCILLAFGLLFGSSLAISSAAKGRTYDSVEEIPKRRVGLVLGCSKHLADGRVNLFYANRVAAAAALFRGGKVDYLLVSGDNHIATYDESSDMKRSIAALGVPTNAIYCDYAGFRTLDSVVRARKVFGEDTITVISQRFHNERAIFIARASDIDAIGFNSAEVDSFNGFRTKAREQLAKVKAVLDVTVLRTKPRFLGTQIAIGEKVEQPAEAEGIPVETTAASTFVLEQQPASTNWPELQVLSLTGAVPAEGAPGDIVTIRTGDMQYRWQVVSDTNGVKRCERLDSEPCYDIRLDAVQASDFLKTFFRTGRAPGLTDDSIPQDELATILITTNLSQVTESECIRQALAAAGLNIEFPSNGLWRVTRMSAPVQDTETADPD